MAIKTAVITLEDGREAEVDIEVPDSKPINSRFGIIKETINTLADNKEVPFHAGTAAGAARYLGKKTPEVIDSPALPIAGGVIGGITGGIPGAMLGGSTGESYRQLGARSLGLRTPYTSGEAAKQIGVEGLTQGAGELVGAKVLTPFAKKAAGVAKKPLGDLLQIITKIKPKDTETLFKNPGAILPGTWEKAQVAWRKAAEEAGLPVDEVSPEIINALKKDARSTVFETFEKMRDGGNVTGAEVQTAKQALDIALMPAAKTERNKPLVALYGKMRQQFVDRIGEESPALAKANKQYAIAASGKKFRSLFPRNLDDSPAYIRSSLLPSAILGLGGVRGEPVEGALQATAASAVTSPLAFGLGIASAGSARPLVPYARRVVSSSLADLTSRRFKGK